MNISLNVLTGSKNIHELTVYIWNDGINTIEKERSRDPRRYIPKKHFYGIHLVLGQMIFSGIHLVLGQMIFSGIHLVLGQLFGGCHLRSNIWIT